MILRNLFPKKLKYEFKKDYAVMCKSCKPFIWCKKKKKTWMTNIFYYKQGPLELPEADCFTSKDLLFVKVRWISSFIQNYDFIMYSTLSLKYSENLNPCMVFTFGTLWCPSGQIDPGHIWGFKNNSNIEFYFINH